MSQSTVTHFEFNCHLTYLNTQFIILDDNIQPIKLDNDKH